MPWGEAVRLTAELATDPASHVGAALAGWEHPLSREGLIIADLYDLQHLSKSTKKPKPYPRPYPDPRTTRVGAGTRLTPAEFSAEWARLTEGVSDA